MLNLLLLMNLLSVMGVVLKSCLSLICSKVSETGDNWIGGSEEEKDLMNSLGSLPWHSLVLMSSIKKVFLKKIGWKGLVT